jgi:hypothetical protein
LASPLAGTANFASCIIPAPTGVHCAGTFHFCADSAAGAGAGAAGAAGIAAVAGGGSAGGAVSLMRMDLRNSMNTAFCASTTFASPLSL